MNIREVNDNDIMKDWIRFREEEILCYLNDEDKKYKISFEEISERVLKNVPKKNQKFVRKQLDILYQNFLDYIAYWNEKYYRNGFVDGAMIVIGCLEE